MTSDTIISVRQQFEEMDRFIEKSNPYGKVCYTTKMCHGLAKALWMLFPQTGGRGCSTSQQPLPTPATINKTRKFLKTKVRRYTDAKCSEMPSVETLLEPDLFAVDESLYSHLRIQGKEVIPICLLTKTIFLGASLLANVRRQEHDHSTGTPAPTSSSSSSVILQDGSGRILARLDENDVPVIAAMLVDHNIIPGGPWAVYRAIYGNTASTVSHVSVTSCSPGNNSFAKMQARLFQGEVKHSGCTA